MAVNIDREIDYLMKVPGFGRYLGLALTRLASGVTNLGTNVGADATKTLPAPPSPQELIIKTNGTGKVQAVISDHNQIQRGIHYFLEYSDNPSFQRPHQVHMGASRSTPLIELPEMDDDGNPQRWHFRAYSQYPASHPSDPIRYGGDTATPVNPGGGQRFTLLPSTGSGTAPANGQSAGQGFGKVLHRPASVEIKTTK